MPLYLFYTMMQKSQKWPKTQIKGGGSCLNSFFQPGVVLIFRWNSSLAVLRDPTVLYSIGMVVSGTESTSLVPHRQTNICLLMMPAFSLLIYCTDEATDVEMVAICSLVFLSKSTNRLVPAISSPSFVLCSFAHSSVFYIKMITYIIKFIFIVPCFVVIAPVILSVVIWIVFTQRRWKTKAAQIMRKRNQKNEGW